MHVVRLWQKSARRTFITETMGSASSCRMPTTDSPCSRRGDTCLLRVCHEVHSTRSGCRQQGPHACKGMRRTLLCRRMLQPGSSWPLSTKDMMFT